MNLDNPLVRMVAYVVAIAAALRLAWLLIEPVLPALAVALLALAIVRVVSWHRRDRW
jgi:hypothetical protein